MGPVQRHANEFQPDALDLHVWPGSGNFELYEDDGESTNYLAGEVAKTLWTCSGTTNSVQISVGARVGTYVPGPRAYYVIRHDVDPVEAVWVNGVSLPRYAHRDVIPFDGWCYRYDRRMLVIRVWDTGQALEISAEVQSALDSDADGMPDWWELAYFNNPTSSPPGGDPDVDGRVHLDEFREGGHPLIADVYASTGGNTNMAVAGTFNFWNQAAANMMLVGDDVWAAVLDMTDPSIQFKFVANNAWANGNWGDNTQSTTSVPLTDLADSAGWDIEASGLAMMPYTFTFNEATLAYSLVDAWSVDSDGDGAVDGWEVYHGLNPLSLADGALDADLDHVANQDEFLAATGPVTRDQYPKVLVPGWPQTAEIRIEWDAVPGRLYDVLVSTNLALPVWDPLLPYTNLSGNGILSVVDTNSASPAYYRIGIRRP